MQREIGRWDSGRPGPTLLVIAGVHGNEPAGVVAAQRVVAHLQERAPVVRGRFVCLCGNLAALRDKRRFLDRDLNRGWGEASIEKLHGRAEHELSSEDHEQLDLLDHFVEIERSASGPILFVDLHTSSADGPPFLCLADTIDNRRIGLSTGVPIILGIEQAIEGASLEWFADRGIAGFAFEGGGHDSVAAVANHEAVLWGLLSHLGILPEGFVDLAPWRRALASAVGDAPPIVEIVYRYAIAAEDRFSMEPGFVNFAWVTKRQLLAKDVRGEVRSEFAGHLMLPLYQDLGDDGFFLARRVRWIWLGLAKWLRMLRVAAILPLVPGIRRDPSGRDTMLVNPKVAYWFVVSFLHLLGFRKVAESMGQLSFSRRYSRLENRRL